MFVTVCIAVVGFADQSWVLVDGNEIYFVRTLNQKFVLEDGELLNDVVAIKIPNKNNIVLSEGTFEDRTFPHFLDWYINIATMKS